MPNREFARGRGRHFGWVALSAVVALAVAGY